MNSLPSDDSLDELLRRSGPAELPGDRFTAGVIAALPLRHPRRPWRRWLVFAGGAAAGILLAVVTSKGGWRSALPDAGQWPDAGVAALSHPWAVASALFTAAATAYVWWRDEIDDLLAEVLG